MQIRQGGLTIFEMLASSKPGRTAGLPVRAQRTLGHVRGSRGQQRGPDGLLRSATLALVWLMLAACKRPAGIGSAQPEEKPPPRTLVASPANALLGPGESARSSQSRKRALLVGINDYEHEEIPDLRGTANDVEAMADVLTRRFGFASGNVVVLRDEQATQAQIVDEFRHHLIEPADGHTVAVFFFSGHGSQMVDTSGDESDGWDETLVPHDSGRTSHDNRDLSDDALNALLEELNRKTAHVAVVLDSCHSGTAVRASGVARAAPRDERGVAQRKAARTIDPAVPDGLSGFRPEGTSYVLISGAASNEYSYEREVEGRSMGALTWFLTRALWTARPDATYRDVMDRVATDVTVTFPSQHPQLEGLERDTTFFGTARSAPEPFFEVASEGKRTELRAGAIHGVTRGSRFAAHAPGTRVFGGTPLAKLEVMQVGGTTSEVRMIEGDAPLPVGARAVETEHQFDAVALRVQLVASQASPSLHQIAASLRNHGHISLVGAGASYDMAVRVEPLSGNIVLESGTESEPVAVVPAGAGAVDEMVRRLLSWAKWRSLWQISNEASGPLAATLAVSSGHDPVVAGSEIDVRVRNDSSRRLYVSLVDLSSDGSITLVYPAPGARELIEPGKTWARPMVPCVPEGRSKVSNVIKVFLTVQPHDLSFIRQGVIQKSLGDALPSGPSGIEALFWRVGLGVAAKGMGRPTLLATDAWLTRQLELHVRAARRARPCEE